MADITGKRRDAEFRDIPTKFEDEGDGTFSERIAELTEAKLKPLSTRAQVRKAVLESIAELETLTKQETLRLESRHH